MKNCFSYEHSSCNFIIDAHQNVRLQFQYTCKLITGNIRYSLNNSVALRQTYIRFRYIPRMLDPTSGKCIILHKISIEKCMNKK